MKLLFIQAKINTPKFERTITMIVHYICVMAFAAFNLNVVKIIYQVFVITFPRSIKTFPLYEVSCSNGCEKVIELLIADTDKLKFQNEFMQFSFSLPTATNMLTTQENYFNTRKQIYNIFTNRKFSLAQRIILTGRFLLNKDDFKEINDSLINETVFP